RSARDCLLQRMRQGGFELSPCLGNHVGDGLRDGERRDGKVLFARQGLLEGQGSRVTRAAAYRAGERTCSPPIRMASNATAAATDNQAPGAARLPVAWIRNVTIAGVDPPMVVARL